MGRKAGPGPTSVCISIRARFAPRFTPQFVSQTQPAADLSHPAIAVNLAACILCTRCVRACRESQGNGVIGLAYSGGQAKIFFDMDDALGASTCVGCGECVQACPTGALAPAARAAAQVPDRSVDSLCPYCGVGCQLTYHVKDEKILFVEGRNGPANQGRLCVKGRYGFDYVRHPQRLTVPLIRLPGVPKRADLAPQDWRSAFREASWDEALALAGGTLRQIRDQRGPKALAGFGSAKGSNEEAFLFQKLVRLGFGSNNVDHCTRLCHASSVAALLEGLGSGAVSNPVMDVLQAQVVIVIGANPTVNPPVAATWIKNAVERGTELVVLDPRKSDLARIATHHLAFKPDTDVALLKVMVFVIVEEGLVHAGFIETRTEGYAALVHNLRGYSPELMAPICGIPAETIRSVARLYASSRASMILWGMGVSQHIHGTDNARCLIALALMTGQIGRPGTGLHPLRGQNNVQGASDAGLIPMMYPDYQRVDNPAVSDPDATQARHALASLQMLVVQDLFLTETAALADVVLPASAFAEKTGSFANTDRTLQLGRQVLKPPGQARLDLSILIDLAQQLGLVWSAYGPVQGDGAAAAGRVFEEMRRAMPSIAGISWARLHVKSRLFINPPDGRDRATEQAGPRTWVRDVPRLATRRPAWRFRPLPPNPAGPPPAVSAPRGQTACPTEPPRRRSGPAVPCAFAMQRVCRQSRTAPPACPQRRWRHALQPGARPG